LHGSANGTEPEDTTKYGELVIALTWISDRTMAMNFKAADGARGTGGVDGTDGMDGSEWKPLSEKIRVFYDKSSQIWERVWGAHMHHGYYGPDGRTKVDSPREAQRVLIDRLLEWSGVQQPQSILDVGCGIGGSSLVLADRYRAAVIGITLSPVQRDRASERARAAGASVQVTFQVADAMAMPFQEDRFDLVWSLESGEHMPDKRRFLQECLRVLKPGGRLVLATWCHRDSEPPSPPLSAAELRDLERIYSLYHLPGTISLPAYEQIASELHFSQIKVADWSEAVAPFWSDVLTSALQPQVMLEVLKSGWETALGARAIPLMISGYRTGLIRYGLLTAVKP
jgi:tocopherol O-methyltransferase